jgi:hypothetical protein
MKELGKDVINVRAKAILEKNLEDLAEGPERASHAEMQIPESFPALPLAYSPMAQCVQIWQERSQARR